MLRSKKNDVDEFLVDQENIPLQTDSHRQHKIRNEQILEAEVFEQDTLVSIALRFNCTVADIKRLNKIHQENEIYAFKIIKVPLTAHNVLLDALPKVHKSSGSNSPHTLLCSQSNSNIDISTRTSNDKLAEKLLVASVSSAVISKTEKSIDYMNNDEENESESLLNNSQFRSLKPPRNDIWLMTFNDTDCELNWIFLLIAILLICFIVPLIYVYFVYEHPEKFNHTHSRYDDTDLHYRAHINDRNINNSKIYFKH